MRVLFALLLVSAIAVAAAASARATEPGDFYTLADVEATPMTEAAMEAVEGRMAKRMTKAQIMSDLADRTGLTKKQVNSVFEALRDIIKGDLGKDPLNRGQVLVRLGVIAEQFNLPQKKVKGLGGLYALATVVTLEANRGQPLPDPTD